MPADIREVALATTLLATACAAPLADGPVPGAERYRVERVVMMMRHGVRPPTKSNVTPKGTNAQPWPTWSTNIGELTAHGAEGARLMGAYNRAFLASRGLLPAAGCPSADIVSFQASGKPRAIDTAKAFAKGFAPGCAIAVDFPPSDRQDPVFHPTDSGMKLDPGLARAASLARAPQGGIAAETAAHASEFALLQSVLQCCEPAFCERVRKPACALSDLPTTIAVAEGKPSLEGAFGVASTAAQTLLLEYVEGKPAAEVGWGRAGKEEVRKLLRFHTTKFSYEVRPPFVAERIAAPLARRILEALDSPTGPRLTMLVGHDTNIASLGGFFDMHWEIADYPPDSLPPGGALGFERVRDASGKAFIRAFYQAQSMDQLRNLSPLSIGSPPAQVTVRIPGCSSAADPTLCDPGSFRAIVRRKLDNPAPR